MGDLNRRGRLAILASSAGVLAVVGLTATTGNLFAPGGGGTDLAPVAESAALQSHANEIFEVFNGTVSQRRASGLLQAWALNGDMDSCMAAAGYPEWNWSTGHRAAPRTNALDTSVWFAPPLNPSYSNSLRDSVVYLLEEEGLRSEKLTEHETSAVVACAKETPPTSDEAASRASTPEVVSQLRDKWWTMLQGWDGKYGDPAAYNSCFDRAAKDLSVDAEVAANNWKRVLAELAPRPADIPPSAADGDFSPAWIEFLQFERELVEADWACRGEIYNEHYEEIERDIDMFATDNADLIDAARRAWVSVEERSRELQSLQS